MNEIFKKANSTDYFLVMIIGFFFGLLAIPILKNLSFPYFDLNFINSFFLVIFFIFFAPLALLIASIISSRIPVVFQFAKFGAVGALNTFLDLGILNFLIYLTSLATGWPYRFFKSISFIIANINSYFWSKHWVFENKKEIVAKEFRQFFIVSLIGVFINVSVASLIINFFAPYFFSNLSEVALANLGAFLAVAASFIWNFIGYKFLVFK